VGAYVLFSYDLERQLFINRIHKGILVEWMDAKTLDISCNNGCKLFLRSCLQPNMWVGREPPS
jgi:hypothetical protein